MMKVTNQEIPPVSMPVESKQKRAYTWLRTLSIGFTIISFCLAIAFVGFIYATNKKQQAGTSSVQTPSVGQQINSKNSSDTPPLLIKHLGVNLDFYDPTTGLAGDFKFSRAKLQFNRLFMGFGFVIPADTTSTREPKANPQPTYIVPLGTPVRSLVDGVVANMPTLWSGDISIQVTETGKLERWVYETEHVINPKVKVGDRVTAGQIIAEVSNFDKGAPHGFGVVEIGILHGGGEGPPEHVCPFAYLDEGIKKDTLDKITGLFNAWESYMNDQTLYEQTEIPGCLTEDPIEG